MFQIRKKTEFIWTHIDDVVGADYILSKFYFKTDNENFQIIERGGSRRLIYPISDIIVYDDTSGGTSFVFANQVELSEKLYELNYPGFDYISGGGGSGNSYKTIRIEWNGTDTVTVPLGYIVDSVLNANDPSSEVSTDVSGTNLTIGVGAEEGQVLLISGHY